MGSSLFFRDVYEASWGWKLILLLFTLGVLVLLIYLNIKDITRSNRAQEKADLMSFLFDTVLMSNKPRPKIKFNYIDQTWQIKDDFSTEYNQVLELVSLEGTVESYANRFFATETAKHIDSFGEQCLLDVRVGRSRVGSAVYDKTPWEKIVAIKLPESLSANESTKISYKFNWPKYWIKLKKPLGSDSIKWECRYQCDKAIFTIVFPRIIKSEGQVPVDIHPKKYEEEGLFYTNESGILVYKLDIKGPPVGEDILIRFHFEL